MLASMYKITQSHMPQDRNLMLKLTSRCVVKSWQSWGSLYTISQCHALRKVFYITKKCNYTTISYKNILYSIIQQKKMNNQETKQFVQPLTLQSMQSTKIHNKTIHTAQSHTEAPGHNKSDGIFVWPSASVFTFTTYLCNFFHLPPSKFEKCTWL
jgi:hypothetical protein